MIKINVSTPIRKGGPYNWGRDLVTILNNSSTYSFKADHIHRMRNIFSMPFYQNCDIVHTTLPLTIRTWNKPVVLTIHGEYPIEKNVWRYFYPSSIKNADIITTPSSYLKNKLGLDEAIVIPNAIFFDQFKSTTYLDNDVINIVTLTKFAFKDKSLGVLDILNILENVQKSTDKKIILTIIGGGKYLEIIKEKSKKFNVNTVFTDFLQDPKQSLVDKDIFIYYSSHDNLPISILEAMATGLPIVSNDVGALNEIIKNGITGHVAMSDENYEECVLELINNFESRKRLGSNARCLIETNYNWDSVIKGYVSIYKSLV